MVEPLAGAGPVDTLSELGQSLAAGDVDSVVANTGILGIETLGLIANPLDTLATSAIGWLLEHVWFLRYPLDLTAGNPDEVKAAVQRWNDTALALEDIANEQGNALRTEVPTYLHGVSTSAPKFATNASRREAQIRGAAVTCAEMARETAKAGVDVAVVRGVMRDMIAGFVWRWLQWAATQLALAPMTFGASTVEMAWMAVKDAAQLLRRISGKLDDLMSHLTDVGANFKNLASRFDDAMTPRIPVGGPTVVSGLGPFARKVPIEMAKENAKVSTTETATTDDADVERSGQLHERWTKKGQL
jgi:hypothetical protein